MKDHVLIIDGREVTTSKVCAALMRHVLSEGAQVFEKCHLSPVTGEIDANVFCFVGPHAAEVTALIREWMNHSGFSGFKREGE